MSKVLLEVATEDLQTHPAMQACLRILPDFGEAAGIDLLQRRRYSTIYRIRHVKQDGKNVIAKRCRARTAHLESLIYRQFFPLMRLPALSCYGIVDEPGAEFCWIFLEEAAGQLYSPQSAMHRALAGCWLAEAHLVAPPLGLVERLPNRNLDYYLDSLHCCREALSRHLCNAFSVEDAALLRKVAGHVDAIEGLWTKLEKICSAMRPTLVHGDLVIKNIRIRETDASAALFVFDWEFSGWGLPATDLAQFVDRVASPDLRAYCARLSCKSSHVDLGDIQAVATCGNLLRWLDQINWATSGPVFGSSEKLIKAIAMLRIYEPALNKTLSAFRADLP